MANRKRSSRRPQPKHKTHLKSQHEKRKRLERRTLALGVKAKVWLAADGTYATRPFLLPVLVPK